MKASDEEWLEALSFFGKEGVAAFVYTSLPVISKEFLPSVRVLWQWKEISQKTNLVYETALSHSKLILDELSKLGLRACILKGVSLAAYYPNPASRFMRDIDVWVYGISDGDVGSEGGSCGEGVVGCEEVSCGEGVVGCEGGTPDKLEIVRRISSRYEVSSVLNHECSVRISDAFPCDVHFVPSKCNRPLYNARLKKFYASMARRMASGGGVDGASGLASGGASGAVSGGASGGASSAVSGGVSGGGVGVEFNLVFCLSHMFRHIVREGFSLKQVVDYWMLLKASSEDERKSAYSCACHLGLGRFAADLMALLTELGLPSSLLLCPPSKYPASKSKRLSICCRYFAEAFWAFPASLSQYIWRRKHSLL